MGDVVARNPSLIDRFADVDRDRNQHMREAMVAIHESPKKALTSIERLTLAVTGSVALLKTLYQLEEKVKEHVGQPLLIARNEKGVSNDELIGIIAGDLKGKMQDNSWGQLIVPVTPLVRWSTSYIPNAPKITHQADAVVATIWGIDAQEELESRKASDSIEWRHEPAGDTVLMGYEEVVCWEGLQAYKGPLRTLLTSLF